jgi:hypothetical protein
VSFRWGVAMRGQVRLGWAWLGVAGRGDCLGAARFGVARYCRPMWGMAERGKPRDCIWLSRRGETVLGLAWLGVAGRGEGFSFLGAGHALARLGGARQGNAMPGKARD